MPVTHLVPVAAPRANLAALYGVRRLAPARTYATLARQAGRRDPQARPA